MEKAQMRDEVGRGGQGHPPPIQTKTGERQQRDVGSTRDSEEKGTEEEPRPRSEDRLEVSTCCDGGRGRGRVSRKTEEDPAGTRQSRATVWTRRQQK